jgi:hypothetical protein
MKFDFGNALTELVFCGAAALLFLSIRSPARLLRPPLARPFCLPLPRTPPFVEAFFRVPHACWFMESVIRVDRQEIHLNRLHS